MKRLVAGLLAIALIVGPAPQIAQVFAAQTAPNTNIVNNATATYKDASNNTYNTTSNTVVTIVQNAPALTNVATSGVQYSPSGQAIDTYTITNTGNASGKIQLDTAGTTGSTGVVFGGTDTPAITTPGGGPTSTAGCGTGASQFAVTISATTTYCDNVTDLNTFLNTQTITVSQAITVQVYYTIPSGAGTSGSPTYTTTIKPNITYAAVGSAGAVTSGDVSATVTNTVAADARLDLYKESSQNGTTGDITYTIYAHNGGANDAKDLAAVKALLGSASKGILITDKVPTFSGSALALSNSGTVSVTATGGTNGYPTGATADTYYSTDVNGASSWTKATGNLPTDGTVKVIGIFIHGGTSCTSGAGWDLCSDTGHVTNPGNVNVKTNFAIKFSFTIVQPTGNGSGNAGSVTNLANGVVGDNQGTEHILGPNCSAADAATASLISTSGASSCGINNTSVTSSGGASNQIGNQALATNTPLNGPLGAAGATGSFDGDTTHNPNDNNHDFTAYSFFGASTDNVVNTSTTLGSPTTSTKVNGAVSLCVPQTLQNAGNKDDTYTTVATAPTTGYALPGTNFAGGTASTGWTVAIYSDSACSTTRISGAAAATASANIAVTSGSTSNYYVLYANANGANTLPYFTRFDGNVVATSQNDNTKSNTTYDELYSSFIALTKSANVTSTGCPTGTTPSLPSSDSTGAKVCPGGQITYSVDYRNLTLGLTSAAASFTNAIATAGSLVITDDGTKSTSGSQNTLANWATFTQMTGAPTDKDSTGATRGATTLKYCTGNPSGLPGTPCAGGSWANTDTAFQATVGGASFTIIPQHYPGFTTPTATQDWQGTLSFTVQVQ